MNGDLPENPSFSISEAAKQIGVHPETLRRWDRQNVLKPFRTNGGQRRYTLQDIETLKNGGNGSSANPDQSLGLRSDVVVGERHYSLDELKDLASVLKQPTPFKPRFAFINPLLGILVFLLLATASFAFLNPDQVLVPISDSVSQLSRGFFTLSEEARIKVLTVEEKLQVLGTLFFGGTDSYFISSLGDARFRTVNATNVSTSNLTVTNSETVVALNADFLDSLDSTQLLRSDLVGKVTSFHLSDETITNSDLSPSAGIIYSKLNLVNSLVSGDIKDGSIATADLADSAITSLKISDGTIVGADLASNITISTTGNITTTGSGTIASGGLFTASLGISSGGNLTFSTDNSFDIGASGATRPRTFYYGSSIIGPGTVSTTGEIRLQNAALIGWRNAANTGDLTWGPVSGADDIRFIRAGTEDFRILAGGAISMGANPAAAGTIRLPNTASIVWRDSVNAADGIKLDVSTNTFRIQQSPGSIVGFSYAYDTTVASLPQGILAFGSTPASAGNIRLPNNTTFLSIRNLANTADRFFFDQQNGDGGYVRLNSGESGLNGAFHIAAFGGGNAEIRFQVASLIRGGLGVTDATPGGIQLFTQTQTILNSTGANVKLVMPGTQNLIALCHATNGVQTAPDEIVDCSGAPSDIAEWYETKIDVEEGDVVSPSSELVTYKSASGLGTVNGVQETPIGAYDQKIAVLQKSQRGYDHTLIGIVSTAPYQTFGEDVKEVASHPKRVALSGRVPVKVTTENGAIAAGDPLTSSATLPGYAMKATAKGRTLGIALEPCPSSPLSPYSPPSPNSPSCGKIMVFINPSWYDPGTTVDNEGDLAKTTSTGETEKITTKEIEAGSGIFGTITATISAVFEKLTAKTAEIASAIIDQLIVKSITAEEITTDRFQIKDSVTGEIHCISLANGEFEKTKGACIK